MKVLEVKNNLVKISYDVDDNLALSSFVIIEDSNCPYVAQVMNLKSDGSNNFAIVKLLFTFDDEGILKNYNGTIPSSKAHVSSIPSSELLDIIPLENPLVLGNLAQQNIRLKVDKSILENNLLICSNNLSNTEDLLVCINEQLDGKSVIIDSEGQLRFDNKVIFGKDFKLPLNSDTIDYIYETDLEDVDSINKSIIQDVLIEVQNYVKTLPEKFLPFDHFINVIDSQYRETQIPELILLKNKLLKYKELNVFAQNIKEILDLSITIDKSNLTLIDISTVPDELQKEVIRYIYTVLNDIESNIYAFVKVNNSNITKRLLKRFIAKTNVYTTVICPHEFKYIEEIKEVSQNIIFFAPSTLTHDFASYNTYLSKLNNNEFVVYGAHTQNIPLIVETVDDWQDEPVEDIANITEEGIEEEEEEGTDTATLPVLEPVEEQESIVVAEDATVEEQNIIENNTETENASAEEEVATEEPVEAAEDIQSEYNDIDIVEDVQDSEYNYPEVELEPETVIVEEPDSIISQTQSYNDNIDEDNSVYVEPFEDDSNFNSTDVVETIEPADDFSHEEMVEQVSQDVDRAFYEKLPSEDDEFGPIESPEDELTEDDLNLIEDLASEDIPLAGDVTYDDEEVPVEDEEAPPVVPIYPASDIDEREGYTFSPGDRVSTAKFGEGIVEKMIKYGNKMLCSIEFPNIGKRLLDPNVTDITKL